MISKRDRVSKLEGKTMSGNIKNTIKLLLLATAIQVGSLHSVSADAGFERVTSSDELRMHIVGKQLSQNNTVLTINADYTFNGMYGGRETSGSWTWNAEYSTFCLFVKRPYERFNCRIIERSVDGNTAVNFRRHPIQRVPSAFFNNIPIFSASLTN